MLSQTLRSLCRSSATSLRRLPLQRCAARRVYPTGASVLHNTLIRCRMMSTPPPQVNESSHLTVEDYHAIADRTMDQLLESMEELVESCGDASQEVDYHSGVLTLNLGQHGTYVINKQPPNKQIWLSSPLSGPKRYDYQEDSGSWVYLRDNSTLDGLLSDELSDIFSEPVSFNLN